MNYTITANPAFNSLEITFETKPAEAVREALKALKFRWHSVKKVWYGYTDEETARAAIEGKDAEKPESKSAKKAETVNKYGVKVGDIFHASWGYEQTNADFFQVVELVGSCSVRVVEVNPPMISETAVSGMSADRVYSTPRGGKLLPPCSTSVFIKDQERGDLKRITDRGCPAFKVADYADATLCGDFCKTYESWYY